MIFWENVKRELKEKKLTQANLADHLEVNFKTFQGWLTRDFAPDVLTAQSIANYLNTTIDNLMSEGQNVSAEDNKILSMYHDCPEMLQQSIKLQLEEFSKRKGIEMTMPPKD